MLIQTFVARLRECLDTTEVFGATDFLGIRENHAYEKSPTFYVLPNVMTSSQQPDTYEDDFNIDQTVRVVVMVDIGCEDFRAEKAFWDVTVERNNLFRCLLGWQPSDCHYPLTFSSGQELGRDGKRIFYAYDFVAREQVSVSQAGVQAGDLGLPISTTMKFGNNFEGRPHGTAKSCPSS